MQVIRSNSSFFSIIDIEIAKTATSFLAFWDTYLHNDLFAYRCNTRCGLGPWPYPCPSLLPQWY